MCGVRGAGKSFIPVFVRPQGRLGSYGAAPLPVTYNIPKVDVTKGARARNYDSAGRHSSFMSLEYDFWLCPC